MRANMEDPTIPNKELLEEYIEEKQRQFTGAADSGDIDSLYEINTDIEEALLALADA